MDKTKREEPRQTCPQCGAELEATIGTGTRHDVVFEICESYTCNLDRQGRTGAFDYYLKEWEKHKNGAEFFFRFFWSPILPVLESRHD